MSHKKGIEFRGNVYSVEQTLPHTNGIDEIAVRRTMPRHRESHPHTLVYAGGFVTGTETNEPCADRLADKGWEVVTINHNRLRREGTAESYKTQTVGSVINAEREKSAQAGEVDSVVTKADSEGGIHVLSYMGDATDKGEETGVAASVFAMSAAIHGRDTTRGLMVRAGIDLIRGRRSIAERGLATAALYATHYLAANPRLSAREIREISKTDMGPEVARLHRLKVPMAFIVGERDLFFPPSRVERNLAAHCGTDGPRVVRTSSDHIGCALDSEVADETNRLLHQLLMEAKVQAKPLSRLLAGLPSPRQPYEDDLLASR